MSKVLQAAFAWADDPEHMGEGYLMVVTLRSGATIRGAAHQWCSGQPLHIEAESGSDTAHFIDTREIVAVTVEFP